MKKVVVLVVVFLMFASVSALPKGPMSVTSNVPFATVKFYNFYFQNDIHLYRCMMNAGFFPNQTLPNDLSSCIPGPPILFEDISNQSALDFRDSIRTSEISWGGYRMFHFFVLNNAKLSDNSKIVIEYNLFNREYSMNKSFYVYIYDFEAGSWEMIARQNVMPRRDWDVNVVLVGNLTKYSNGSEIRILGSDNLTTVSAPITDYFSAKVYNYY